MGLVISKIDPQKQLNRAYEATFRNDLNRVSLLIEASSNQGTDFPDCKFMKQATTYSFTNLGAYSCKINSNRPDSKSTLQMVYSYNNGKKCAILSSDQKLLDGQYIYWQYGAKQLEGEKFGFSKTLKSCN